jgi:hypothetical protein
MTVLRWVIGEAERSPGVSVEFDGNPIRIYRADKASSVELLSPIAPHAPAAVQLAQCLYRPYRVALALGTQEPPFGCAVA